MIDGLGVAGWGVGGIEAEAAMLGQVLTLNSAEFSYWRGLLEKQLSCAFHAFLKF